MAGLSLDELEKAAAATAPQAGGNLLTQIAAMVKQFREGAELLSKLKEQNLNQAAGEIDKKEPGGGMAHFITLVNSLGLGDLPIGKILEQIGPYSVNQLNAMGNKMIVDGSPEKPPEKPQRPPALDDVRHRTHEN